MPRFRASTANAPKSRRSARCGRSACGIIQEIYCDYNTKVKKGQICGKIDPRPYETLVAQAKANLLVGKAQLQKDQANLSYTRAVSV